MWSRCTVGLAFRPRARSSHIPKSHTQQLQHVLRPQTRAAVVCWLSSSSSTTTESPEPLAERTTKHKIVYLGTPEVAATTLSTLYNASQQPDVNWEIAGVVTQPPKRRRRKGASSEPSPVGLVAESLNLTVWAPVSAKEDEFLQTLEDLQPDLCITAAYGQYLPKRFLACPRAGTVNIHPSLLPKYRGASPVQRSLQNGDNPVGVTVLYSVSKMDAGPIISQTVVQLDDPNETARTVLPKLFEIGTRDLINALPDILHGNISPETATPQREEDATNAPLIATHEATLSVWNQTATQCHNQNRAFALWPNTMMWLQPGDRDPIPIKVFDTAVATDERDPDPTNTVVRLGPTKQNGLFVTCYDGSILELKTIQPATKKAYNARDFQNGYKGETIKWVKPPEH